jgi:hypothetical protein
VVVLVPVVFDGGYLGGVPVSGKIELVEQTKAKHLLLIIITK